MVSQSIWPSHYWWALRLFLCFSLIVNVIANSLIHTSFGTSVRVSLRGETAWSLNRYSFLVLIDTVTLPPKFRVRSYSHQQYTTATLLVETLIVSFLNHGNDCDWTPAVSAPKWYVTTKSIRLKHDNDRVSQPPKRLPLFPGAYMITFVPLLLNWLLVLISRDVPSLMLSFLK